MSKDDAIFVLRSQIRLIKSFGQLQDKSKRSQFGDLFLGIQQLLEAYAMVLDDSTKAQASAAFDRANKTLFDVTQDNRGTEYQYLAGACASLAAAMKWLYFSKPPAKPW